MSEPPKSAQRGRSASWRRAASAGSAPAAVTVPGSPPQNSRIMAVAASIASGISAGSRPRSNRCRASETIWWRRPVSATRTGSNSAHSMNTLVVVSSQPVASPPITPAIDCTPAASQITQSSGVDDVVLAVQRAQRFAGAAAAASARCPTALPTSNTCSGRPRSKVKKLVMSTSALIGRSPIEVSRSCSHFGLGAFVSPRMVRPRIQGQASGNVDLPSAGRRRTPAGSRRARTASACRGRRRRGRARRRGR